MSLDKNNIDVPDFINIDFFKEALRIGLNQTELEIENVVFTMRSKPGENYCSTIYRADVEYSESNKISNTISLIVKSLPINLVTERFQALDVFGNETKVYMHALPKIEAVLHGERLAPKFFYYTKNPIDTIVFEDITPLGYILADRVKGLDEEHCELIFQKLAKYHAASMDLAVKSPEMVGMFTRAIFGESNQKSSDMFDSSFTRDFVYLAKLCEKWNGYESISQKLLIFKESLREHLTKSITPIDNEIKVLTHNDLWTNNILFQYENDKLKDLLLIDFQASYFCSPGIDITHFLYTSPQLHLLENKRDYMIEEYYYKQLKATLEDLNYSPIPSLDEIFQEIENREMGGFLWSVCKLYLICMDKDKCGENNFDNIADAKKGAAIREIGMSSERYQNMMKYILKRMEKIGVI